MTNEEKFKDEILDIAKNWNRLAVSHGKPCACESISCPMCDLFRSGASCHMGLQEWLDAEYEQHITVEQTAYEMEQHCQRMYSRMVDILKSKGLTDEEIIKTNLHLHVNSVNALYGRIRHLTSEEASNDEP